MSQGEWDPWNFRTPSGADLQPENLLGFDVHAKDGHVGKVDAAHTDEDASRIVVDAREWFPGGQVVLPAGTVERIDMDESVVYVGLTKEQIRNAPRPEQIETDDPEYRSRAGFFFAPFFGRSGRVT